MHYDTALRAYTAKRLEEIEQADILVGIPCYNNEKTIAHVIKMVTDGLAKHYKDKKSLIFIADGGSTDDTREVAKAVSVKPRQEKVVFIYRGPGGKGTAVRSIFEAAHRLKARTCALVDADLRSITPDWIKHLMDPILENGYQFVTPVYLRHKYDGTISKNIVYNLTRALYGKRIRHPMGGDFALSRDLARYYIEQDVWMTDVARFGIDIWMTTSAITQGFRICQSNLGVKIHDGKDPGRYLGPFFRQVLWTLFYLMEHHEGYWRSIKGSEPLEILGYEESVEPEPVIIDPDEMMELFSAGYLQFAPLWKEIFSSAVFDEICQLARVRSNGLYLPTETWVRIVYELASAFHRWTVNRSKLLDLMAPLYYARVASFVKETWEMSSQEAENLVEEQAIKFEEQKDYLIKAWYKEAHEQRKAA